MRKDYQEIEEKIEHKQPVCELVIKQTIDPYGAEAGRCRGDEQELYAKPRNGETIELSFATQIGRASCRERV